MKDLDVGRDGMVWGCTASGKIIYRAGISVDELSGTEWITEDVSERCANIAICTSGHVWAVTPNNEVIFRTGIIASTFDQDLVGTGWQMENPTSMAAAEVACGGNRQVWMTGVDGKLYHKTNTQDFTRPQGDLEPELIDSGSWSSISVAENGQVFGLKDKVANARIGYSAENPTGTGWSEFDVSMEILNFNAGNNEIWMVNDHHEVYRRTGVDHAAEPYAQGQEWEQVCGRALMRFVATAENGITWAIDPEGSIWRYKGGEITIEEIINNVDHEWTHVENNQLIRVDVGYNSQVVGIESNGGNALFRTGVTETMVMGDNWANLGSGFTDITMCRNGRIWATDGQSV
jgi:hypothetical protein